MTRRATAESLPASPPAPDSATRAKPSLFCPGLLLDLRPGLIRRRKANCAHLGSAEIAWIDEHGSSQARCPKRCVGYEKRQDDRPAQQPPVPIVRR